MATLCYFERDALRLTMTERLHMASSRLQAIQGGFVAESGRTLRPDQVTVFDDCVSYFSGLDESACDSGTWGRIVLPPRTGKTVVAAQIIRAVELMTTFIVPTKDLVEQTSRELEMQMPGVLIGRYYGDVKEIAEHGVMITTYQSLVRGLKNGSLPEAITRSSLVIPDEAHHAMGAGSSDALRNAFDPHAMRIAMTATPTYSEHKTLATLFPDLIHEVTLPEAVALGLLAPLRVYLHEVDVDASKVEVVAGEFREDHLAELMTGGPFFRAAELLRYDEENKGKQTLICCVSRQQAYDLRKYLLRHRPDGTSEPGLILSDTLGSKRQEIIGQFEQGKLDTLINVGCLIEGWNSPNCKLLIDLAPTASRVRAMQKFFRVMTKQGDAEAHIHMLSPRNLPCPPCLPMDFLYGDDHDYWSGELIASGPSQELDRQRAQFSPLHRRRFTPIENVRLVSRVVLQTQVTKPDLDPRDMGQIRKVILSNPNFRLVKMPSLHGFRWMLFRHPLFTGRGDHLLRFLGIRVEAASFDGLIARLFPDEMGSRLAGSPVGDEVSCQDDLDGFLAPVEIGTDTNLIYRYQATWQALSGGEPFPDIEKLYIQAEQTRKLQGLMDNLLMPLQKNILRMRFGFNEDEPMTLIEIGNLYGLSRERIRQLQEGALDILRKNYDKTEADHVCTRKRSKPKHENVHTDIGVSYQAYPVCPL